jgi:hypothetical protein
MKLANRKRKYRCNSCLKTVLRVSDKKRVRSFCDAWQKVVWLTLVAKKPNK